MIDPSSRPELPEEIMRQLTRVEGYLDLKMIDHAEKEFAELGPATANHAAVRLMKLSLMIHREQWAEALPEALALREDFPDEPACWIQHAFVTRRAVSLEAARAILTEARALFPNESIFDYNLACYACRLGEVDRARATLNKAMKANKQWRSIALKDDDLIELHEELEEET